MILRHQILFLLLSNLLSANVLQPTVKLEPPILTQFIFDDLHLPHDRNLIVHLFEWKWTDIEEECKNYLSQNGFGAVQVSVSTEHVVDVVNVNGKQDAPWYHRYQPISYKLNSRSGTEKEFAHMVEECNKVNVRIIVDVVINHMCSVIYKYNKTTENAEENKNLFPRSSGGTAFNAHQFNEQFSTRDECMSYNKIHFHDVDCNADIKDYNDRFQVQTCRLLSLSDLKHEYSDVQNIIACFLNHLLEIGVVGFRIDASRHIAAQSLSQLFQKVNYLNPKYFGANKRPFVAHEVIDYGASTVTVNEYTNIGRVINFNYHIGVTNAIRNLNGKTIVDLLKIRKNIGYGNIAGHNVLNFLDNHDTQRYEHDHLITHKNPWEYRIAVSFLLASNYGVHRLMSSYLFSDKDEGPPSFGPPNFKTQSPEFNNLKDGGCKNGWVCEHRWPEIRRMANFRQIVGGAAMAVINYAHSNCFGFARLEKGYYALNNDRNNECILKNVDTSLPDGEYCNVFLQDINIKCEKNNVITVIKGKATIKIQKFSTVAFTLTSQLTKNAIDEAYTSLWKNLKSISKKLWNWLFNSKKTIIFIKAHVEPSNNVFLRGGRSKATEGCNEEANENNKCVIPIKHVTVLDNDIKYFPSIIYEEYRMWSQNDKFLDNYGAEYFQGTVDGAPAEGTPMIYTTNKKNEPTYNELNDNYKLGDNYWMGFSYNNWEPNNNHEVQCGKVNILTWGKGDNRIV